MSTTKVPRSKATNAYELLNEVVAVIQEEPKRLNMSQWLLRGSKLHRLVHKESRPICNTVACVAGWVVAMRTPVRQLSKLGDQEVESQARELLLPRHTTDDAVLNLRYDMSQDVYRLFHTFPEEDLHTPEYVDTIVSAIRKFQDRYESVLKARIYPKPARAVIIPGCSARTDGGPCQPFGTTSKVCEFCGKDLDASAKEAP